MSAHTWRGDAAQVATHLPKVQLGAIQPYLHSWETENGDLGAVGKAHPDDTFSYGDSLQLLDFMRRLGLTLPDAPAEPPVPLPAQARQRASARELSHQKHLANLAWQQKKYEEVVRLLGPLISTLTPVEQKKLEYAKKQSKPWWQFW